VSLVVLQGNLGRLTPGDLSAAEITFRVDYWGSSQVDVEFHGVGFSGEWQRLFANVPANAGARAAFPR
jgi:hypothetical protein